MKKIKYNRRSISTKSMKDPKNGNKPKKYNINPV
jgi:hypothetical protein